MTEALVGLGAMLLISFLRVPIAISMGLVGFLGLWWMRGLSPSMASATTVSSASPCRTRASLLENRGSSSRWPRP